MSVKDARQPMRVDITENPPVFVVGSGRCGTSVMQLVLEEHPKFCSTRFEPRVFVSPDLKLGIIPFSWNHRQDFETRRKRLLNYLRSRFSFTARDTELGFILYFERSRYESITREFVGRLQDDESDIDTIRRFLADLYRPVLGHNRASRWVDSHPINGQVMPEILEIVPNARFIHMIRDGRDVARSFVRLGWCDASYELSLQCWYHRVITTRNLGRHMCPDHYLEVEFDSFVREPKAGIRRVCEFLGEPFHERMCRPISEQRASKFVVEKTEYENYYFECLAGHLAEEYGWE